MESMLADLRERKELNVTLKIPSLWEMIKIAYNRKEWHLRTPYQKWAFFYGIGRASLKPIGLPLYEEDQTILWRGYFIIAALSVGILFPVYTTYYYVNKGEVLKGLPCTCLLGVGICYLALAFAILRETRKALNYVMSYGGRYIYPDRKIQTEYDQMCSDEIDKTIRRFCIQMLIMSFFYAMSQVWPVYKLMKYGIKTTLTEIKFPFIEEDSDTEYILNLMAQVAAITMGGLVHIALEVARTLGSNISSIMPKIIQNNLEKFRLKIEDKTVTKMHLKLIFKNIIKEALYMDLIISCGKEGSYYHQFVESPALACSVAIGIFCQYSMGYAAGYGLALLIWVQLFYSCELSQDIADTGYVELLNDFEWYALPIDLQRDFILLLSRKQNAESFTVGPFGSIDRELFAHVAKRIYSMVMFLLNVNKRF